MTLSKKSAQDSGPEPQTQEDQMSAETPEIPGDPAELRRLLLEKTQEAEENYRRLLRMAADLENMKKRQERDRAELHQFANENLLKELLPVVDNLERALDHGREMQAPPGLLEGIDLVYQGFLKVLEGFGVTSLESVGQQFDPAFHNAVMQEETGELPDCSIIKELQKGYLLHQRLLRPAMVVVARHPQNTETTQTDTTVQEER
jgi:molecular chaperone GrpE